MTTNNFNINLNKGTTIENFLIDYFLEVFGWSFVAGTKNGEVINISEIEKLFGCKYVHPINKKHGPKLKFSDNSQAIMPDILFKSSNNFLFWVESKSSFDERFNSIDIEKEKIESYFLISEKTKKPVWIVLTFVKNNFCDIYSIKISDFINDVNNGKIISMYNPIYRKICYQINIKNEHLRLLGKEKII